VHLPGGQTIRVVTQPASLWRLTFLYEDVTARLTLESDYNTLIKVQSATLDTLSEGVAVFGPDGKLKLHNAVSPHLGIRGGGPGRRTACPHHRQLSRDKFGDCVIWDQLIQAIMAGASARDLGDVERSDRSILSLSTSPLPDGATLVTFNDRPPTASASKAPARPQRRAGSRRPAQVRFHQACVL